MLLLLYFALQLQLLNLSSPKTEDVKFVGLLSVWRGEESPSPPPPFPFFFINFIWRGKRRRGWHRVGAGDVIKALAE